MVVSPTLLCYEFSKLKYIYIYHHQRDYHRQRVILENISSDYLPVQSDVPQGSILGPLLFVLFINDISLGIYPKTNITLFVDDTKIWRPMESDEDCTILQRDIDYHNNWCKLNQMKFHPDKCKVVSIISKINKLIFKTITPVAF